MCIGDPLCPAQPDTSLIQECFKVSQGSPDSVNQRRVVELIRKYGILRAKNSVKESQVGSEARGVEQAGLLVHKHGQLLLQLSVKGRVSPQQGRAGGSASILFEG